MEYNDILEYANRNFSKVQSDTFRLSPAQMDALLNLTSRIMKNIPEDLECDKVGQRHIARTMIDGYMDQLHDILTAPRAEFAPYIAFVVVNFTWRRLVGGVSLGEMRFLLVYSEYEILEQGARSIYVMRCVSSHDKVRMDEIIPEEDLVFIRQRAVSRLVVSSQLPEIFRIVRELFKTGGTKHLGDLTTFLDHKKKPNDTLLYLNLTIFKKEQEFVVKLHAARNEVSHHYAMSVPDEQIEFIRRLEETLTPLQDPVRKLRSYATQKNLPFLVKSYRVPEEAILIFYTLLNATKWNHVGALLYETQKEWNQLPPYSGVFPLSFAVCLEDKILHISAYSPYNKVGASAFIMPPTPEERVALRREFFPDPAHADAVRKHALNPNLQVKPEDTFLLPYIQEHRMGIISQNVLHNPTNRSLPKHLAAEIEKWRQHYTKKVRQHALRHPDDTPKLGLHPSYTTEIQETLRQKEKNHALQQYLYAKPTDPVPADHPFRQDIQKERRRVRQQTAKYETIDDLAEDIWKDLNLMDPITDTPIKDPVRSPYVETGVYQKQNLEGWLSRGGLRLDPLSRKEMPSTFKPQTDQRLKAFIGKVDADMSAIVQDEEADDEIKKIRLHLLRQNLTKNKAFQQIIKKKQQKK